jgi:hypothetical protein
VRRIHLEVARVSATGYRSVGNTISLVAGTRRLFLVHREASLSSALVLVGRELELERHVRRVVMRWRLRLASSAPRALRVVLAPAALEQHPCDLLGIVIGRHVQPRSPNESRARDRTAGAARLAG